MKKALIITIAIALLSIAINIYLFLTWHSDAEIERTLNEAVKEAFHLK